MSEVARGIEVENLINCDARLRGVMWSDDGIDLILMFEHIMIGSCSLECTWASGTTIDLDSKPNVGGGPLTKEAYYEKIENGRFRVKFNFADRGCIDIECNDLVLKNVEATGNSLPDD